MVRPGRFERPTYRFVEGKEEKPVDARGSRGESEAPADAKDSGKKK
jgi:hypothetical protein